MLTKDEIIHDLINLGVKKGDTLFLRISYKALGKLDGGPQTFIDSLLEVIGCKGTIIVITLPKRYNRYLRFFNRNKKKYDAYDSSTITTGIIPKLVSTHKKVVYSKNQYIPFCAIGYHSKTLMEEYTNNSIPYEPMIRIAELGGKCLRIGGKTMIGTTHISLTKSFKKNGIYQKRLPYGLYIKDANKWIWYDKLPSLFCSNGFNSFYHKYLEKEIMISTGKVGEGNAVITDMRKSLEIENLLLSQNPELLLCNNPHCLWCRYTYSFSKNNFLEYTLKEIYSLIKSPNKKTIMNIYNAFKIKLFGTKCQ